MSKVGINICIPIFVWPWLLNSFALVSRNMVSRLCKKHMFRFFKKLPSISMIPPCQDPYNHGSWNAVVFTIEKNPRVSWPAQVSLVLFSGQPYKITYRKSRVTERNAEDFSLMVRKNKSKETWESGWRGRRKPREKSVLGGRELDSCVEGCWVIKDLRVHWI